jgi:hypothetical protein
MSTFTSGNRGGQRSSALAASAVATTAGGAMDAWISLTHGHVFANAPSGNVRCRRAHTTVFAPVHECRRVFAAHRVYRIPLQCSEIPDVIALLRAVVGVVS